MSSGLALLSHPQSAVADPAPVSFATLVGPTRPPRRKAAKQAPSSDLLATVAHELRTPLASLRLSLDMLVNDFDQLDAENAMRLMRRAQRSVTWLQRLTENLTSAAAAESGHLQVRPTAIDLRECIEDAVLLVRGLLDQRGQRIRFTTSTESLVVKADPARVIQIIANLLSNASRYSVEGDEIELHVSAIGRHLRVRVTDHGPGITPEDQQRIFGAWIRAEGSASGGLGLGLNIVQNLVQHQDGRVGVESILGQGATFWFTLPCEVTSCQH
jgi:signal transduction histidine kinase